MLKRRKVLLGLSTSIAVAGCGGSGGSEESEENKLSLEVVDENGNAIEGATVKLQYSEGNFDSEETVVEGETNSSGIFKSSVDNDEYTIVVDHSEYRSSKMEATLEETDASRKIVLEKYQPEFSIDNVITPLEVVEGDEVTVRIEVSNQGQAEGTGKLTYYFIGQEEISKNITLDAGSSETIKHTFNTTGYRAGELNFIVGIDGKNGSDSGGDSIIVNKIYEIDERFIVREDDIAIAVTETASGYDLGIEEADGIFRAFEMEIENIGDESVRVGSDNFKMEDTSGRRYEADRNLLFELRDSISGTWDEMNPGITTTKTVGFDIPEDRDIPYFVVISGVFTGNEEEAYKVRYKE